MKKTLVLVGGGHAHVYLLKKIAKYKMNDVDVILISSKQKQYYSGMASGYLEDIYNVEQFSFNLSSICKKSKISFIEDEVIKFDPINKRLQTLNGKSISYDIISLDTGSDLSGKNIKGNQVFAQMVKPLSNLETIKKMLLNTSITQQKLVIIGAGAAGIEISLAVHALSNKNNRKIDITVIDSGSDIMRGFHNKVKRVCLDALNNAQIKLILNNRVNEITKSTIMLNSNDTISYTILINATGTSAHDLYRSSTGLHLDKDGYMLVSSTLQALDYPYIFGAGDCISFVEYDYVNKVGVYAIKEAPILWANIKQYIDGNDLMKYKPQKSYLAIISIGNRLGVLAYKNFVLSGRLVWLLKNWIDQRFMRKYK